MKVTFYSTNCPRCKVLAMKMAKKGIEYETVSDVQYMLSLGLKTAPALSIDGGPLMDFAAANKWINDQEDRNGN